MIIRKPYAFLIKNFKKIHIFLLLISLYVAYRLFDVSKFVNDFMSLGSYDLFQNPITNHITTFLLISLLLLVIGSLALLFLLYHKGKPWKAYLIPTIEYFLLFFVLNMIKSFFGGYSNEIATTDLRFSRDLLLIFSITQIPAIFIFFMRVFGLDFKKFNFNSDQEFLELSEADREEVEIGLNFDKNTFLRIYRRTLRNLNYFYLEHKTICRILIVFIVVFLGFQSYKFIFVTNKSYKEGDFYSSNGYTIQIKDSYFTDKDFHGEVISEKSNFVIVSLRIQNHDAPRTIYFENLHLKNGTDDYVTTRKTYSNEFHDLGVTYNSSKKIKRDEVLDLIVVYKVNKKAKKNRFSLFYQENGGKLRKIKLNVKDISEIQDTVSLKIGDEFVVPTADIEEHLRFSYAEYLDECEYHIRKCTVGDGCETSRASLETNGAFKILKIEFSSDVYEVKNMIDFLRNYGKLIYKDSEGESKEVKIESAISRNYFGKIIYLKVPNEMSTSNDVRFEFIVRNKNYVYKIF